MARLTIPDEQTFAEFSVVTSTASFPITFSLFAKADLTVYVDDEALEQSDFSFTGTLLDGGGYDGGTVVLNDAVDDVTLRIERNIAPARTSNFAPSASTPVGSVDQALNRLTAVQQDLKRRLADAEATRIEAALIAAAALQAQIDAAAAAAAATSAAASSGFSTHGTLAGAQGATVPVTIGALTVLGRTTAGIGRADYIRTSLATITAAGYPAAAYFRSTDRFMPDGSTDATNGGYWLNASDELNFLQFGAAGDATVTDDLVAVRAAILFSKLTGRKLRPVGTYRVNLTGSEKIVINCDGFDGSLCHLNVYGSPTIACEVSTGDAANPITIFRQLMAPTIIAPSLENKGKTVLGWASQGIGLRVATCQNTTVKVPLVHNFAVGVQLTSYTQSTLHNLVRIGILLNNKVNIQLAVGDAGASTNSNTFAGPGHCVHFTDEGEAVSGCRHIEVVPHPTRSIINHTIFRELSLEGTVEDYHVYDGGQSNSYVDCRWETMWALGGPRFRQGQSSPAQAGQGGNHRIIGGYGADEFEYLTVSNDTDAELRMVIDGPGLDRRVKSGPTDLINSTGSGAPVFRGFTSADNLNTVNRDEDWSWRLSDLGLDGKMGADAHPRIIFGFDATIKMGNGTAAPTLVLGNVGSGSGFEIAKSIYLKAQSLNPGNLAGYGVLSFMDDDTVKVVLPSGTVKTLAFVP